MIQFIDPDVLQFEILPHLDDRSMISLLSTCKLVHQVISIPNYIETKLKIMDKEILGQKYNNLQQSPVQVDRVNEIFRLAYLNFREEMFLKKKQLNLETVKVDEAQCYEKLKAQYILLKRYVFSDSTTKITHCNRSVFSYASNGLWISRDVNFTIKKDNTVYYWSIVLTAYDRKISNSWVILVGFAKDYQARALSNSLIGSGYCIKSNAIVENGDTSYNESDVNKEGDVIGLECYKQKEQVFFNVYTPSGNHQTFQFNSVAYNIVPMVSIVNFPSLQLISLLPWDGHVESLKSFGPLVQAIERNKWCCV